MTHSQKENPPMICASFHRLSVVQPEHCYNCVHRHGYPTYLFGDSNCDSFIEIHSNPIPKPQCQHWGINRLVPNDDNGEYSGFVDSWECCKPNNDSVIRNTTLDEVKAWACKHKTGVAEWNDGLPFVWWYNLRDKIESLRSKDEP